MKDGIGLGKEGWDFKIGAGSGDSPSEGWDDLIVSECWGF